MQEQVTGRSRWQERCRNWPTYSSYDRIVLRSETEIGPLGFRLSISQNVSLGDFMLAPVCSIKNL